MATRSSLAPFLIVVEGGIPGAMLPLPMEVNTLGRAADNTVQLVERTISRHHALLVVSPEGQVMVTDLNSSNGTFLHGRRVPQKSPVTVSDGDHLRLGSTIVVKFTRLAPDQEMAYRARFDKSVRDDLTKLYKMDYFLDRVGLMADRMSRAGQGQAVAMIDIDYFLTHNERLGRKACDELLRIVSRHLQKHAHEDDLVARLGGDTFLIARATPDFAAAQIWAEQLRADLAKRWIPVNDQLVRMSISVGLGYSPPASPSSAAAIATADFCLTRAKVGGRNCVVSQAGEPFWIQP